MKRAAVGVVVLVAGAALWWCCAVGPLRSPARALAEFYRADDVGEDQIPDPLILTQCRSAALVEREIRNPNMPRRRYAIAYLGNRRCDSALPVLRAIAVNPREFDYFRGDALEAIAQIDPRAGVALAGPYRADAGYLGDRARAVLRGDRSVGWERSYWQAVMGEHD